MKKLWRWALFLALTALALCPAALAAEETGREFDLSGSVFMKGSFQGPQTLPGEAALFETWEQQLYQEILTAVRNLEPEISVRSYHLTDSADTYQNIKYIFSAVLNNNPELFYFNAMRSSMTYESGDVIHDKLIFSYMENAAEMSQVLNAKIHDIISSCITPEMTQLQKALALHDYIVLNCQYDYDVINSGEGAEKTNQVFDAYGALVDNDAVCQGYAEAYMILMREAGIPDIGIVSNAHHAWNWVTIEGKNYHVDVTSDDPVFDDPPGSDAPALGRDMPGYCRHLYFLVSSDRIDDELHEKYPENFKFYNREYESGYLFCEKDTGFFGYNGELFYVQENDVLTAPRDLRPSGTIPNEWAKLSIRWGNDLYFLRTANFVGDPLTVYRYDLTTGEKQVVNDDLTALGKAYALVVRDSTLEVRCMNGTEEMPLLASIPLPVVVCTLYGESGNTVYSYYLKGGEVHVWSKRAETHLCVASYYNGVLEDLQVVRDNSQQYDFPLREGRKVKIIALGPEDLAPECISIPVSLPMIPKPVE